MTKCANVRDSGFIIPAEKDERQFISFQRNTKFETKWETYEGEMAAQILELQQKFIVQNDSKTRIIEGITTLLTYLYAYLKGKNGTVIS